MKIRTDFVTNSSSSSFVAVLDAMLDNGDKLTASAETSNGGEEGGWISTEPTDYEMDVSQIAPIDELARNVYTIEGQKRHIASGSIRLMCHTYGEYGYEANPKEMMNRYLGKAWGAIIDGIDTSLDEEEVFTNLRSMEVLKKYSDDSLWSLIEYAYDEDYYPDTEIVQTLNPDGTLDLEITTGEDLFDVNDVFSITWSRHEKGNLVYQYDPNLVQRSRSITLGRDHFFGTEEEIQVIFQQHMKEYAAFNARMVEESKQPMDEYLASKHFSNDDCRQFALENLDLNEVVEFEGKHFVISPNSKSIRFKQAVEREIKMRGGITQDLGYGEFNKDIDYLVISPHVSNFWAIGSDVRRAIREKEVGNPVKIITEYQL